MSRTNPPHGRVGRPPVTSRTQIITVARRLIDESGWAKLTIRGLAAELGIGATTLYHHVRDKEDLLLLLIHEYAQQIPHPEPSDEPRDRIIAAATSIHDALTEWPLSAEVLTGDRFISRLSTPALRLIEEILSGAVDHGCTPEQAVQVFRDIWYFTVGEVLIRDHSADGPEAEAEAEAEAGTEAGAEAEAGTEAEAEAEAGTEAETGAGAEKVPAVDGGAFVNDLDPEQLPLLTALNDRWTALAARDTYPATLGILVDGLLAQAAPPAARNRTR
ncbi:TetR/AcrR family transcriptional regulator [Streptomyces althioticus]|uniref:TetR/AcrR family transcriptional regulator n=1 Tax=Streptomyces althioticus TaxID=83380 RepID=UPI0036FD2E62